MDQLEIVALHLQTEALRRLGKPDVSDLFGRSAYNRYYYATFLRVRKALSGLDEGWQELPHSNYPGLLKGQIVKKFKKHSQVARKIGDHELIALLAKAASAAQNLSDLMETGYTIRVVADYRPDIAVIFEGTARFKLNEMEITEAHQWPEKADIWTQAIVRAWEQIDD